MTREHTKTTFDGKLLHCACGAVGQPDWNPYDGVWECYACGAETDEIPGGPRDAHFNYNNQNPGF